MSVYVTNHVCTHLFFFGCLQEAATLIWLCVSCEVNEINGTFDGLLTLFIL